MAHDSDASSRLQIARKITARSYASDPLMVKQILMGAEDHLPAVKAARRGLKEGARLQRKRTREAKRTLTDL